MNRKISISDITIKQMAAASALPWRTKIELAKLMDRLGVDVIETGPIINGKSDSLLIKSLSDTIKGSSLAVQVCDAESVEPTWDALKKASCPRLQLCLPVSTVQMEYLCHKKPDGILETIKDIVSRCAALCGDVEFMAQDFVRADKDFVKKAIQTATDAGANIITICDTVGSIPNNGFYESVRELRQALPDNVRLGFLFSNELFLADACAVSAVIAGADELKTVSFGADTVSLPHLAKILTEQFSSIKAVCGIKMTELQSVGAQIAALCENKEGTYPAGADKGRMERSGVMLSGKDDKATVLNAVKKFGYELDAEDEDNVYEAFTRLASKNGSIEAKELDAIVASVAFQAPQTYKLESYLINSGNFISATCHLRLQKDGQILESVCLGDGPVDAAFHAIEKLVGMQYELDDFQIQSVTQGREAMGEAVVRLRCNGKLFSGRGISTDIVGSSIMAHINAINKIFWEEQR